MQKMNKREFILFLTKKAEERNSLCLKHWAKTYSNSNDYWHLNIPCVDWLEDDMDLTEENIEKITYNKSLCGDDESKTIETTYEDFIKNYDKRL